MAVLVSKVDSTCSVCVTQLPLEKSLSPSCVNVFIGWLCSMRKEQWAWWAWTGKRLLFCLWRCCWNPGICDKLLSLLHWGLDKIKWAHSSTWTVQGFLLDLRINDFVMKVEVENWGIGEEVAFSYLEMSPLMRARATILAVSKCSTLRCRD